MFLQGSPCIFFASKLANFFVSRLTIFFTNIPNPFLSLRRGFNLFTKPLPFSKGRGLKKEIAETDDFLFLLVSRDTRFLSYATALQHWGLSGHAESPDTRCLLMLPRYSIGVYLVMPSLQIRDVFSCYRAEALMNIWSCRASRYAMSFSCCRAEVLRCIWSYRGCPVNHRQPRLVPVVSVGNHLPQ